MTRLRIVASLDALVHAEPFDDVRMVLGELFEREDQVERVPIPDLDEFAGDDGRYRCSGEGSYS